MNTFPIEKEDKDLLAIAISLLQKGYKKDKHGVAAALRTKDGKVFTAVHLESSVGKASVCAEAVVLGKAISEGESTFSTIVAVWYPQDDTSKRLSVAPPCGLCRELLSDYQPDLMILTQLNGEMLKVGLSNLLPNRCDAEYNA